MTGELDNVKHVNEMKVKSEKEKFLGLVKAGQLLRTYIHTYIHTEGIL